MEIKPGMFGENKLKKKIKKIRILKTFLKQTNNQNQDQTKTTTQSPVPLRHCLCPGASAVFNPSWGFGWFGSPDLSSRFQTPQVICSPLWMLLVGKVFPFQHDLLLLWLSPSWLDPHGHGKPCVFFVSCLETVYIWSSWLSGLSSGQSWVCLHCGSSPDTGFVAACWCLRLCLPASAMDSVLLLR